MRSDSEQLILILMSARRLRCCVRCRPRIPNIYLTVSMTGRQHAAVIGKTERSHVVSCVEFLKMLAGNRIPDINVIVTTGRCD